MAATYSQPSSVAKLVMFETSFWHKKVSIQSSGQKQRVAIARALVSESRLILADEPTGSQDQDNSIQVMELLKERLTEKKITLIVVTHNPEISELAKRQIRMIDGRIISDQLSC